MPSKTLHSPLHNVRRRVLCCVVVFVVDGRRDKWRISTYASIRSDQGDGVYVCIHTILITYRSLNVHTELCIRPVSEYKTQSVFWSIGGARAKKYAHRIR